jgi:hypothetical protein
MNRNEWIWVAIRVFGVYLLVLAATSLPDVANAAWSTYVFAGVAERHPALTEGKSDAAGLWVEMTREWRRVSLNSLVASVARVVLYSIFGYYLLRKGNFLFRIVSRQGPPEAAGAKELPSPEQNLSSERARSE